MVTEAGARLASRAASSEEEPCSGISGPARLGLLLTMALAFGLLAQVVAGRWALDGLSFDEVLLIGLVRVLLTRYVVHRRRDRDEPHHRVTAVPH